MTEWLAGGEDLGVELHHKLTLAQLDSLMGLDDGHFQAFRQHIAKDSRVYVGDRDEEIEGKTQPFRLRHHQLVGIAAILQGAFAPKALSSWPAAQPNLHPSAPIALRRNWGSLPGRFLSDSVGLGKTFEVCGVIAALIQLFAFQESPSPGTRIPGLLNGNPPFGVAETVPNAAHIIVVPNSLMGQWAEQLRRAFLKNSVAIIVIESAEARWKENMDVLGKAAPIRRIYLLSLTVRWRASCVNLGLH
jgi:SNF2 family DNA or RNA helicase